MCWQQNTPCKNRYLIENSQNPAPLLPQKMMASHEKKNSNFAVTFLLPNKFTQDQDIQHESFIKALY